MNIFLKKPKCGVYAEGIYDENDRSVLVLKGAKLSSDIREYKNGATHWVSKMRIDNVENNILIKDLRFKTPSTASNFITGRSTNGLIAWKNEEGKTIKEIFFDELDDVEC